MVVFVLPLLFLCRFLSVSDYPPFSCMCSLSTTLAKILLWFLFSGSQRLDINVSVHSHHLHKSPLEICIRPGVPDYLFIRPQLQSKNTNRNHRHPRILLQATAWLVRKVLRLEKRPQSAAPPVNPMGRCVPTGDGHVFLRSKS